MGPWMREVIKIDNNIYKIQLMNKNSYVNLIKQTKRKKEIFYALNKLF